MYNADLYSSNNSCIVEAGKYVFKKYGSSINFPENASVLEIGCGDGNTTCDVLLPALQNNYKELVLTDKSKSMLEYARKRDVLSHMQFVEMAAETKEIPRDFKGRFDLIYSNFALQFVTDSSQTVQNIYDMLKPGGEAFCSFLAEFPQDHTRHALGKHPKWSQYDPNPWVSLYHNNPNVYHAYKQHLTDSGFHKPLVISESFNCEVFGEKQFRELMASVNLSVEKIPKHLLDEYLDDYIDLLKKDERFSFKKTEDCKEVVTMLVQLVVFHAKKPED